MRHLIWIPIMAAWAFTGCATIDRGAREAKESVRAAEQKFEELSESRDTEQLSLHGEAIKNGGPQAPDLGDGPIEKADESLHAEAIKNSVGGPFAIAEEEKPAEEEVAASEPVPAEETAAEDVEEVASGDCDKDIIAMSEGAVGNPCMTTEQFMKEELGFNDEKVDEVLAMRESVGRALAH